MKTVAIIPARGGSKRIPKKNIKSFCAEPIISYPIKTAIQSGVFDDIYVSSDDDEILSISSSYGAKSIKRPANLSDDLTPTLPVIAHACKKLKLKDDDIACVIYPTAPLLRAESLMLGAKTLLNNPHKNYAFSSVEYDYNPYRAFEIQDGAPNLLYPKFSNTRSQDLNKIYHDAGQFYFGYVKAFIEERPIFDLNSLCININKIYVQDIDDIDDFVMAEIKYQILKEIGKI